MTSSYPFFQSAFPLICSLPLSFTSHSHLVLFSPHTTKRPCFFSYLKSPTFHPAYIYNFHPISFFHISRLKMLFTTTPWIPPCWFYLIFSMCSLPFSPCRNHNESSLAKSHHSCSIFTFLDLSLSNRLLLTTSPFSIPNIPPPLFLKVSSLLLLSVGLDSLLFLFYALSVDNLIHPCKQITISIIQIPSSVPYQFIPDMSPPIQMGVLVSLWISHLGWLKALNVPKSFPLSSSLIVVSNTASSRGCSHAETRDPVFLLSLPSVFWFSPHRVSTRYL